MLALFLIGATALAGCSSGPTSKTSSGAPTTCDPDGGANPAECPATWSDARSLCEGTLPVVCPSVGLRCGYPGSGDGVSDGQGRPCLATAVLLCAPLDGGAGQWHCAQ